MGHRTNIIFRYHIRRMAMVQKVMYEDWLRCKGLRPRLALWLRLQFHWKWVDRIILRRAEEQFEDEQTQTVLDACITTGHCVTSTVDNDGNMTLTIHENEDKE
jgi:hypothetical protein